MDWNRIEGNCKQLKHKIKEALTFKPPQGRNSDGKGVSFAFHIIIVPASPLWPSVDTRAYP
jgi:hypothetical protein